MMISRRQILGGIGAAALASLAASQLSVISKAANQTTFINATHGPDYFPNAVLINHKNEQVKFYDDLIKDKFVVINMMYAQCNEGVCPITTMNMRRVQMALGNRVGRDIHLYSITLLPDFDTPAVLKQYAKNYKAGPGWQFLTGQLSDIEIIRKKLGFYDVDPKVDADLKQHAGVVRIGYDAFDKWMMAPALGSPESILQVIRHADRSLIEM
jgi:protein SCO1/2